MKSNQPTYHDAIITSDDKFDIVQLPKISKNSFHKRVHAGYRAVMQGQYKVQIMKVCNQST